MDFRPCMYKEAYSGMCCQEATCRIQGNWVCFPHKNKKCNCGKQAIKDCGSTEVFCVVPLCEECECKHDTETTQESF